MPLDDWDKAADGTVTVLPLLEFETAAAFGMAIALRLKARCPPGAAAATQQVQIALSPKIAKTLAMDLWNAAERIEDSHKGPRPPAEPN